MKKIIFTLIILFNININYIYSYNNVYNEKNLLVVNNDSNNNVKLIEGYILELKSQINLFVKKYQIDYLKIKGEIIILNDLSTALHNIKYKNYSNEDYNKIINIILDKLKISKDNIKNILKIEKDNYEKNYNKKFILYDKIGKKINIELNKIIKKYYYNYEKKHILTTEDNEAIKILKNLSDESVKLKNFSKINFKSISEMTDSFSRILKNIKREMINLNKLI